MSRERIETLMAATNAELDARLRALELQRRAVDAEVADVVAVATSRLVHLDDGHHSMKGYLRATCNWSNAEVDRVRRAARLVDRLPEVGAAWAAGRIGAAQIHELAAAYAHPRCGDQLPEFAPVLLDHAEHLPFEDFRVCVQRFVLLADVDGAHRDRDAVFADRTARVTPMSEWGRRHLRARRHGRHDRRVRRDLRAVRRSRVPARRRGEAGRARR